jgi:hypothetical protein
MPNVFAARPMNGRATKRSAFERPVTILLVMAVLLLVHPARAGAADNDGLSTGDSGLGDRISSSLRVLTYGTIQDAAASSQNPGYAFLDLPGYQAEMDVRPDLALNLEPVDLSIKPRLKLHWQTWDQGDHDGDSDWDNEGFVNEWLARFRLSSSVFVSYGRENLQWGPSYLLSPSNPFFNDNGRSNPKQEVAGMDFARLVWLPDAAWTVSLIANTGRGRQPDDAMPFEPTYGLKVDYVGESAYGGMVLSSRNEDRTRLGFYGGVTATDALLLYAEGNLSRGTAALYPVADDRQYFGAALLPTRDESSDLESLLLLGGAYTLQMGPTLSLEYVYNSVGYNDRQADLYYRLRGTAAAAFAAGGPGQAPAAGILGRTAATGLRLLRQHYLMVQFSQNDIGNALDLVLRWTHNLDDHGSQWIAIAEYFIGDHVSLFSVGTVNLGGADTEFGSFIEQQWMVGVQYAF